MADRMLEEKERNAMLTRRALLLVGAVVVTALFAGVVGIEAEWGPADNNSARFAGVVYRLEVALAENDATAAVRAWREAYDLALASDRWEPMLEVADTALVLGDLTAARGKAETDARDAYQIALVRARRVDSRAGLLRVTEALEALGPPAPAPAATAPPASGGSVASGR